MNFDSFESSIPVDFSFDISISPNENTYYDVSSDFRVMPSNPCKYLRHSNKN